MPAPKRFTTQSMIAPTRLLVNSFQIILNGRGTDFDPDVVDAFMEDKTKIERIYAESV